MVNISKWALLGIGIITASLFFREAAATTLTGTLSRTGLAGAEIGTGINKTLTGLGSGTARLIDPLFSLVDLFGKIFDMNVSLIAQLKPEPVLSIFTSKQIAN